MFLSSYVKCLMLNAGAENFIYSIKSGQVKAENIYYEPQPCQCWQCCFFQKVCLTNYYKCFTYLHAYMYVDCRCIIIYMYILYFIYCNNIHVQHIHVHMYIYVSALGNPQSANPQKMRIKIQSANSHPILTFVGKSAILKFAKYANCRFNPQIHKARLRIPQHRYVYCIYIM